MLKFLVRGESVLEERLAQIGKMVDPESRLADIGTDHAYLSLIHIWNLGQLAMLNLQEDPLMVDMVITLTVYTNTINSKLLLSLHQKTFNNIT